MSENRYIVTQEIKSEAQYKKGFYSKDIMFVVVFMMVSYFLKPLVATKLQYPFLIGSLLIAVFLRTPAIYNKKRKTLDSLVIYMRRENTVYHPIFRQNKISASDQDKRGKVASTILDLIDLRNYNEQHRCFQRKDGSYIDFFKIKTRDRGNTAENEIQYDILKFLKLLQTYEGCLKIESLNFPTNTSKQQAYYKKKIENCKNTAQKRWLTIAQKELEWVDQHTTKREYYLVYYADTMDKFVNLNQQIINKLRLGQYGMLEELSQEKKEDIYFKLFNPSSIIRNTAYEK